MSLKNRFIAWQINQRGKSLNRRIRAVNLAQVQTAGIIWKIEDSDVFKMLVELLKELGIQISSICFADQPGSVRGEVIFSPADFSFFGKVNNEELDGFIKHEFDLLIDISLATGLEAQYVRALSKARFKVGWSDTTPDYFDLSIDIRNRREPSFLAEQIIHYLSEINKKEKIK